MSIDCVCSHRYFLFRESFPHPLFTLHVYCRFILRPCFVFDNCHFTKTMSRIISDSLEWWECWERPRRQHGNKPSYLLLQLTRGLNINYSLINFSVCNHMSKTWLRHLLSWLRNKRCNYILAYFALGISLLCRPMRDWYFGGSIEQ